MSEINHPTHYQSESGYECIEVMRAVLTEEQFKGFCLGNAFKYIWRAGKKDVDGFYDDVRKANWYLRYLSELPYLDEVVDDG